MDLKNIQYNKIKFYLATEKPSVTLFYKKTLIGLQIGVWESALLYIQWRRGWGGSPPVIVETSRKIVNAVGNGKSCRRGAD
jgi:hypothetical protein